MNLDEVVDTMNMAMDVMEHLMDNIRLDLSFHRRDLNDLVSIIIWIIFEFQTNLVEIHKELFDLDQKCDKDYLPSDHCSPME